MRRISSIGVSIAILGSLLLGSRDIRSAARATDQHQWGVAYLTWAGIDNLNGATRLQLQLGETLSQEITPLEKGPATYWAVNWSGPPYVYGGIQTSGSLNFNGGAEDIAIFSVWDATKARQSSGSICKPFFGEGVGMSCRHSIPVQTSITYRLNFTTSSDSEGIWLTVQIATTMDTREYFLGSILLPAVPNISVVGNFIEYFGAQTSCDQVPGGTARFSAPTISRNKSEYRFTGFSRPVKGCVESAVDAPPMGSSSPALLRFGGKQVESTITTTTTVPLNTVATSIPSASASSNLNGKKCTKSGSLKKTNSGNFACVKIGGKLNWKLLR